MTEMTQPTALKSARNFAQANVSRAAQWRRWQSDADDIWKDRPELSRHSVARLVRRRLQVPERTDSIARRIRK